MYMYILARWLICRFMTVVLLSYLHLANPSRSVLLDLTLEIWNLISCLKLANNISIRNLPSRSCIEGFFLATSKVVSRYFRPQFTSASPRYSSKRNPKDRS